MSVYLLGGIIIAISVILSTIINLFIMRLITEIAAKEINKIENRWIELMEEKLNL